MKYALVLDSLQDVQKFTEIVQQIDADVRLLGRDENGSPWELSAKSVFCTVLFGTHLQRRHSHPQKNIDWNAIYCECNHDIYHLIRDYVKGVRFMKPKEKEKILQKPTFEISVDFKEQTPKVEIHSPKSDPLYEKAFLSCDDKNTSEYALNTTTWD